MRSSYGEPIECKYPTCSAIFQRTTQNKNKLYCCRQCSNLDKKGKTPSEEWLENIRKFRGSDRGKKLCSDAGKKSAELRTQEEYSQIGKKISEVKKGQPNIKLRGSNHPNWKGGISQFNRTQRKLVMDSLEYKNWRRKVFERDNYSCVECGIRSGKGIVVEIHADHIKSYKDFPEFRLDIDNGRTLCKDCHVKTPTWGGRVHERQFN
jgi:hypothetical protein